MDSSESKHCAENTMKMKKKNPQNKVSEKNEKKIHKMEESIKCLNITIYRGYDHKNIRCHLKFTKKVIIKR